MSLYISIRENIYINSIFFAAITCETTLARLINSDQKHIDVGPTLTVLSGMSTSDSVQSYIHLNHLAIEAEATLAYHRSLVT